MTLYARPPTQNMGEFEKSRMPVASPRSSFSVARCREERTVLVDHALRCTRGTRRVDDHHAVVGGDVVLDRVEQRVGHVVGTRLERGEAGVEPRLTEERCRRRAGPVAVEADGLLERGDVVVPAVLGHAEQDVDVGAGQEVAQLASASRTC